MCSSSSLLKASACSFSLCIPGKLVLKASRVLPFLPKHLTAEALMLQIFTVSAFTCVHVIQILPLTLV